MKKILSVHAPPPLHWVGDGFPVRSLFHYANHGRHLDPFLLLDHAAPTRFPPSAKRRGVGMHPHRGFETVTIVYQGEAAHKDTAGNSGHIGPGDVQWMTAASGILHEEYHSERMTREGGVFEVAQLWVNLPARLKMSTPGYQAIVAGDIPVAELAEGAGSARVIAGTYAGASGPARTHSPMLVADLRLRAGATHRLVVPDGWSLGLVAMEGDAALHGGTPLRFGQLAIFERRGTQVDVSAVTDVTVLVLAGEPLGEPVVGHGPFVMNTEAEIHAAFADFRAGKMGIPR